MLSKMFIDTLKNIRLEDKNILQEDGTKKARTNVFQGYKDKELAFLEYLKQVNQIPFYKGDRRNDSQSV